MPKDFLTVIDFSMPLKGIKNLRQLPPAVQTALKSADRITKRGFHELNGDVDNRLTFSAAGHYTSRRDNAKFVITSIGFINEAGHWQWNSDRNEVYRTPQKAEVSA